ncbi:portal protein [Rickettsiella endosymbiont of Dermanyssus gallinae]|uniref:portal protein n=1 Tax=Rickettsiella endosymbiont of Dermanyssus gallinae TaxID=2856608 RepID=UPI001C52E8FA|nr:portal protein [Rickettsiella endosymbiont of Dermanyssus gallinae]
MQSTSAASLFIRHQDENVITSSSRYAKWTLPQIFPESASSDKDTRQILERDYQSKGAMLVNSLASKIVQALFPQNFSFFRIYPTPRMLSYMQKIGIEEKQVDPIFSSIADKASRSVLVDGTYSILNHAIKQLIITGNSLIYRNPETKRFSAYSVRDYVVRRQGSEVFLIVLKESISLAQAQALNLPVLTEHKDKYAVQDLYTCITKEGNKYNVYQEINNVQFNHAQYAQTLLPYIPTTWNLIQGEHYGRGHVEDYAGDFARLSQLSQSSLLYGVAATRLIHLVDSGSGISEDDFADANTGDYVSCNLADKNVIAYEGGEYSKLQAIQADIQQLLVQLSIAFMYSGNTRDAERVTAEEIRTNAQEANQALGGVYSNISDVLHTRLAQILISETDPRMLPLLMEDSIGVDVLVGMQALNDSANVTRLQYVANAIQMVLPVLVQSSQRFNPDLVIDQICSGFGVDRSSLSYTEEELKQKLLEQQQSQQDAAKQQQETSSQMLSSQPQQADLNAAQQGLV